MDVYFRLLLHKLVKAAQIKTIPSSIGLNNRGIIIIITPERILNCLSFRMFLSICVPNDPMMQHNRYALFLSLTIMVLYINLKK